MWFPLLGLTPSGVFMGSISTLIYTSELILCSTIFKVISVPPFSAKNAFVTAYLLESSLARFKNALKLNALKFNRNVMTKETSQKLL